MKNFFIAATSLVSLAVVLLATPLVSGANFPPVDINGKVLGFGKMEMYVQTDDNKRIVASADPDRIDGQVRITGMAECKFTVIGTEKADFLSSGLYVRFNANLIGTQKSLTGAREETVSELEVFTPSKDSTFGAMPNIIGDPPKRITEPLKHFVVGRIASYKRGALQITIPNGRVKVKVANDATVKINVNDPRYARKGDKVNVKGFAATAPKVFATEITVDRGDATVAKEEEKK